MSKLLTKQRPWSRVLARFCSLFRFLFITYSILLIGIEIIEKFIDKNAEGGPGIAPKPTIIR